MTRRNASAWLRWLGVPWREWTLATALIGAAAAPAILVASADLWFTAVEDDVAVAATEGESIDANGIDVTVETAFDAQAIGSADREIEGELEGLVSIGSSTRTVYTFPGLMEVGPPRRSVGPAGRLFARDGALDAVTIVEQLSDIDRGVWVTTWFGDRHDIQLGDGLSFEAGALVDEEWNDRVRGGGAQSVFRVVGFYEPLWSEASDFTIDPYWADVPAELLPVYIEAFNEPNAELVLTAEATLLDSGLTGVARWTSPLVAMPDTFDGLRDARSQVRSFEQSLVGTSELGASMVGLSTPNGSRPRLTTEVYETTELAERSADRLAGPLSSARTIGGLIGLSAMVAVGAFFVERRRVEFRLLVGEGQRAFALATRIAGQLAVPTIVGSFVGILGAVATTRWFGPAHGVDVSNIRLGTISAVAGVGLICAASTAGWWGARVLRPVGEAVTRAVVVALAISVVAAASLLWIVTPSGPVAGRDDGSIDVSVVALPVSILLAVTVVVLLLARIGLRWFDRFSERLPTEMYLAVRRLSNGGAGLVPVVLVLGLGLGLMVFSSTLTGTLDRTVDVKLSTEIGGETSVGLTGDLSGELSGEFGSLDRTTVIRRLDTALTPGSARARILAIDAESFSAAVDWPSEFGSSPDDVMAALGASSEMSLPVVAISGESAPPTGAFGLSQAVPYRVVGTIRSFPGAGVNDVTLIALADSLDDLALRRAGFESFEDAEEAGYRALTSRFGRLLVSQESAASVTAALDEAGLRYRDVESKTARRGDPDVLAARAAFQFLGMLGVVAAAAALVALALYVSAQRRSRRLIGVMTRSMGLSPRRSALAAALELAMMLVVVLLAAFAAAPLAVTRLARRFDPAPDLPPDVRVVVSWVSLVGLSAIGLAIVTGVMWFSELRAARRPAGEVLRDVE